MQLGGCVGCILAAVSGSIPQVTLNRAAHEAAVDAEVAKWQKAGFTVTRNVSFVDPRTGKRVVADYVVSITVPDPAAFLAFPTLEPILVRDVKTGAGQLTPNQAEVYPYILRGGEVVPVGLNAALAGFELGVPTSIQELYAGGDLPSDTHH